MASRTPPVACRPKVWLDRLIAAEQAERQARSLRYQMESARFPIHRDLLRVRLGRDPLQKAQVEQLDTTAFMGQAHNLIWSAGRVPAKPISQSP